MYIFSVEFFGKVAFSSPYIQKSDVLSLNPQAEFASFYREIYMQRCVVNLPIIKQYF